MPEYKKHEGFATGRTRRKMEPILGEWYDVETAPDALIKYLPQPTAIGDVLERVVKKKIPACRLLIFRIQSEWKSIAGEAAAKYTRPFCLKDGILDIEVRISAKSSDSSPPDAVPRLRIRPDKIFSVFFCISA